MALQPALPALVAALLSTGACAGGREAARPPPPPAPSITATASAPQPASLPPPPAWLARHCATPDPLFRQIAGRLVDTERAGALAAADGESLGRALRAAGSPYPAPRSWVVAAKRLDPGATEPRLAAWLGAPDERSIRHCGVAYQRSESGESAAMVVADTVAEPLALPLTTRNGTWLRFEARMLVPAERVTVVALGPRRGPLTVPTAFHAGRASAVVRIDQTGPWILQLLADTGAGPTPALDAVVFADTEPDENAWLAPAPGESAERSDRGERSDTAERSDRAGPASRAEDDPAGEVRAMVNEARVSEGLPRLLADRDLDRLADQHAQAMRRVQKLAHDAGRGDPIERARAAGISVAELGENVAHAPTPALAHRALWYSPSHRLNLLHPRFARMGAGVAQAPDGTVWIVELFATAD